MPTRTTMTKSRQLTCPEGYGNPPNHIATHTGTFYVTQLNPAGQRVTLDRERCNLEDAGAKCKRGCNLGHPASPLHVLER